LDHIVQNKVDGFFSKYPLISINKSSIIMRPKDYGDFVFKIDQGRVIQYDISNDGSKIVLNVFKAPAYFPMSWAINKTNDNYFFEAHSDCKVRRAPLTESIKFIKNNPDVMYDLLGRLYSGIDGMQRRNVYFANGSAMQRMIYEVILMATRFGDFNSNKVLTIPFSEQDIAHNSGLTRETVNREISKLKKLNLLTVEKKLLHIQSVENLDNYLKDSSPINKK